MKNKLYKGEENLKSVMGNYDVPLDSQAFEQFSKNLDTYALDNRSFIRGVFSRFSMNGFLGLLLVCVVAIYGVFSFSSDEELSRESIGYPEHHKQEVILSSTSSSEEKTRNNSTLEATVNSVDASDIQSNDITRAEVIDQNDLPHMIREADMAKVMTDIATEDLNEINEETHLEEGLTNKSSNPIKSKGPTEIVGSTHNEYGFKKTLSSSSNSQLEITASEYPFTRNARSTLSQTDNRLPVIPLSTLDQVSTSLLYSEENLFKIDPILVAPLEEHIERPKSQINIAIGGGMTQLNIDEPYTGDIKPFALANQEAFLSVSYLYRAHRNVGIETGVRATYQSQKIAHYFQSGDYELMKPQYGEANVNAFEGKYEFFSNVHFYLPLGQRSELDFHIGYFARNPLSTQGSWGSSHSRFVDGNTDITLIKAAVSGKSGPLEGGRLKLGVNYNFLTNNRNTVGLGISYMHELIKDVEGSYEMLSSTDFTTIAGNMRVNGSGIKVQFNYGFGLKSRPFKRKLKNKNNGTESPWYVGLRYGTKGFIFNDKLSKDLISVNLQQYAQFFLGHYIRPRLAVETGFEFSKFVFSTPSEFVIDVRNFELHQQAVLTLPFALRYDLIEKERILFYGKGVFSTDFRLAQTNLYQFNIGGSELGYITDRNKLLLNAGLEAGLDFKLFKGVHLGLLGKYNHAFNRLATYQYPVKYSETDFGFEDINLKNQYFSWGVELKYMFNR